MKYILFLFLTVIIWSCNNSDTGKPTNTEPVFESRGKSKSVTVSLTARTKFDSKVAIDYIVNYRGQHSFRKKDDSLNIHVREIILDSLSQYELYDIYSTKRYTVQLMIEEIYKKSFTDVSEVILQDVEMSEEALQTFRAIDQSKQDKIDSIVEARNLK